jgi:phosphoethanolamine N-methyltransferase
VLNWLARYAPAGTAILDDHGRATGSVLDVGCGPHGFACAHPDVPFVGLDVEYPQPVAASMSAIQAPPGPLPFGDGAFHTVLSLDTLEHVPRPARASFVSEIARVAAHRVLLACSSAGAAPSRPG